MTTSYSKTRARRPKLPNRVRCYERIVSSSRAPRLTAVRLDGCAGPPSPSRLRAGLAEEAESGNNESSATAGGNSEGTTTEGYED
jgi:hypothetical protein